jgi:hypothetical protein
MVAIDYLLKSKLVFYARAKAGNNRTIAAAATNDFMTSSVPRQSTACRNRARQEASHASTNREAIASRGTTWTCPGAPPEASEVHMQRMERAITTYRDVEKGKEPGDSNRAATVHLLHG